MGARRTRHARGPGKPRKHGVRFFGEIEERWVAGFGRDEIAKLRKALLALVSRIDLDLPDCLPILGYGLF